VPVHLRALRRDRPRRARGSVTQTGYRPFNHEKYWGFHGAWRNPRQALDGLEDLYAAANAETEPSLLPLTSY
jgi:hypothetical protein